MDSPSCYFERNRHGGWFMKKFFVGLFINISNVSGWSFDGS